MGQRLERGLASLGIAFRYLFSNFIGCWEILHITDVSKPIKYKPRQEKRDSKLRVQLLLSSSRLVRQNRSYFEKGECGSLP